MNEEKIQSVDGLSLNLRSWRSEGAPRAVVAIVPGFNSHGGHYLWVGEQLAAAGFSVYAIDLRGRGKSDGERFFVEKFSDYTGDVDQMLKVAKERDPGLPIFLLGHSAGGVISCGYTLEHQADLRGLICESFAFRVPAPDFALAVLKGLSHLAPHAHVLKLKTEDFSRDPEVMARLLSDPLIENEVQPTLTVAEMVRADERIERDFALFTLPLLIIHAPSDKVTRVAGSQMFYDKATGAADKTLKLYEGYAHDPLNDLGKEVVLGDIVDWVSARI